MNRPEIAVISAILSKLVNKVNYRQTSIIIDRFTLESAAYADSAENAAPAAARLGDAIWNPSDLAAELAPRSGPNKQNRAEHVRLNGDDAWAQQTMAAAIRRLRA
jgi:hypothetical protein